MGEPVEPSARRVAASGSCAVLIGFTCGRSLWMLVAVAFVWGFSIIANSAALRSLSEHDPLQLVGNRRDPNLRPVPWDRDWP